MTPKSIVLVLTRYLLPFVLFACLSKDVKADRSKNVVNFTNIMEDYWNSNLPNTSMPQVIKDLINADQGKEKIITSQPACGISYRVKWNTNEVPSDDVVSLFFQLKDIYPGAKLKEAVNLRRSVAGNAFVSRTEAEAIQFSSKELSKFLNHYSIIPDSEEAKKIEQSLHNCETRGSRDEKKFCAASFEQLIDNVISELGTRNIRVMATVLPGKRGDHKEGDVYKIASPIKKLPQEKLVLCHPLPSPRVVFYCHTMAAWEGYVIPLEGNDKTKVNALALCHYDTRDFSAIFFEALKVKPGTKPLCHFLPEDHLMWAPHA